MKKSQLKLVTKILTVNDLKIISGGEDSKPVEVVGQIGGNSFDTMTGGVRVTVNIPVTDTVVVHPSVVVDVNGVPHAGGVRVTWETPF